MRLQVREDTTLRCITIEVAGLQDDLACILAPNHALNLSLQLTQACARLRNAETGEDLGPPNLGPGSLGSTF